jgi:signal transduction histidine kinase
MVVQESVTNVVRHSGAREVVVVVRHDGDELFVDVVDPGPPLGPTAGSGRGLQSMERRVAALGGTVSAGPEGQGFAVRARLPLQRTP